MMVVEVANKARLGTYILTKRLAAGVLGERWLALDERKQTSHVVHRFGFGRDRIDTATFQDVMDRAATLNHAHILKVEAFDIDLRGRPYCVTPFTGDRDGLVSLDTLLKVKGGSMSIQEAKRAADQLLGAVAYAHCQGCPHGQISMHEVLVDRHGSLQIELYAVARMLGHPENIDSEQMRREINSVLAIAYQLVTGLRVEEPVIPAGRVLPDLDKSWDELFETGLNEPGFTTAAHALSALRACKTTHDESLWNVMRMRRVAKRIFSLGA